MAAFLGEIAFLLGVVVAAAGLVVFGRAGAQPSGVLFGRLAGALLFVAGAASAICTGMLYSKFYKAGEFDHAYPPAMMREASNPMDRMEMMRQRRMQRLQERGMQPPGAQQQPGGPVRPDRPNRERNPFQRPE
jgi:hypothetical protein